MADRSQMPAPRESRSIPPPDPDSHHHRVDIISSRLGRKLVYRFLFVGMVPLVIFCIPLYLQTTSLLDVSARSTLVGYSQLAKGTLFSTLEQARSRLERIARDPANDSLPLHVELTRVEAPFQRYVFLDASLQPVSGETAPWRPLDTSRRAFLRRGRVVLTPPYEFNGEVTLALVAPVRNGYLAAEMDPVELWAITRAGMYGPHNILMVVDAEGQMLATSGGPFRRWETILSRLPRSPQASGEEHLPRLGDSLWGFNEIWLGGAFGGERWGLLTVQTTEGMLELPLTLMTSLLVLLGFAFCAIVILSFRYVREILTPVVELAHAARATTWTRGTRVSAAPDDEIGDLATSFNSMTFRLRETHEESVRLTREAMVGRLAAMVAHQVNTPLAAMKIKLERLEATVPTEARSIHVISTQVTRIETIVKSLLGFARLRSRHRDDTRVIETTRGVEVLFRDSFESRGVHLEVELPADEVTVNCPPDDLQELLVNLLENARESCLQAGPLEDGRDRSVRLRVECDGDEIIMTVEDEGAGLPSDDDRIFDPFVTSKISGTGLGLAICRRICETCKGTIKAERRDGGGARFVTRLPISRKASQP